MSLDFRHIIDPQLLVNYIHNKFLNIYTLNEVVNQYLSTYKTVTNLLIIYKGKEIYNFRKDDQSTHYTSCRLYKYKLCQRKTCRRKICHKKIYCRKIFILLQFSNRIQGPKFTIVYDKYYVVAERSSAVIPLSNIIFDDQGLTLNDYDVIYIELEQIIANDLPKFKDSTSRGYNVYISALPTDISTYMADLYFNNVTAGIYHVNCYSTSSTLSQSKNLIRLFPPDSFTPPIFVKLATNDIIILYEADIPWSAGLNAGITILAESQGKTVTSIPITIDPASYIDVLATLPSSVDKHSILTFSGFAMDVIDNIRTTGVIDNKFPFNLFFGDGTADSPVTSYELLLYLQEHDTLLIQPFLTERSIILSQVLNAELDDPQHPVSQNVIFFYACIDVALLLANMTFADRLIRSIYPNFEINQYGDNINGYYSGLSYIGLRLYKTAMIIFINREQLFIGRAN